MPDQVPDLIADHGCMLPQLEERMRSEDEDRP
jgi:hypothetical protein